MLSIFVLSSFICLFIMFSLSLWCLYSTSMVSFISSFAFSNSLFLLSWNFLSVSCTFWLTLSCISHWVPIVCLLLNYSCGLHWVLWHSLSSFCWSLNLSTCFLHSPLVPVLIFCCGETSFPVFSVFLSLPLVLLLSLYCVQLSIF
jgi:hypothetical protein